MLPLPFVRDLRELPAGFLLFVVFKDFPINLPVRLAPERHPLAVDGSDGLMGAVRANIVFRFIFHGGMTSKYYF